MHEIKDKEHGDRRQNFPTSPISWFNFRLVIERGQGGYESNRSHTRSHSLFQSNDSLLSHYPPLLKLDDGILGCVAV